MKLDLLLYLGVKICSEKQKRKFEYSSVSSDTFIYLFISGRNENVIF